MNYVKDLYSNNVTTQIAAHVLKSMKIPIFLALSRMYAKINSLIHEMRYFKQKKWIDVTQQSLLSLRRVLNIKGVTFSTKCISLKCPAQ